MLESESCVIHEQGLEWITSDSKQESENHHPRPVFKGKKMFPFDTADLTSAEQIQYFRTYFLLDR